MDIPHTPCEHRWSYFVDVASRAVRTRRCDLCGARMALTTVSTADAATPEPLGAA
ncbi:MAG: hypothetical protein U5Q44_15140 [Dehalococcoidia bacterium]|nr:hypothetical protein [Dehalococcoidia bacterium]